jgi:hypothetical protein
MNFKLKVFINKRNGQGVVSLPKKAFDKMPTEVEIKVPKNLIKKTFPKAGGRIW